MRKDRKSPAKAIDISIPGFDVTGFIARGGMSTVYRATELATGRDVALKVVRAGPESPDDTQTNSVERLLSEGGLLAALKHPHLMPVHAIGDEGDLLYVAMSYASGGDLAAKIGKRLPVLYSLGVAICVAKALHFAHQHGLVHRDVKPGNVLFMEDGTPVLSDFGLAKPFGVEGGITSVGMVLGSPEYMSPEQAMGQALDGRTDIYSLGVMLYAMLTGAPPYRARTQLKTIRMHLDDPVPALPTKHRWLQPVIDRSMAKSADERFSSAGIMAKALLKAHDAYKVASERNK